MERGRGRHADGVSRFLSTLAILIAVGSSYFLYQENRTLKAELTASNAGEDPAMTYEAAKVFNTEWDEQLTTSLSKWQTEANAALELDNQARAARTRLVEDAIANLQQSYRTELIALVDEKFDQKLGLVQPLAPVASAASLSVAENRMRPIGESGANYVVIANDGETEAEIQAVVFRPRPNGQFMVTAEMRRSAADGEMVIQFSPIDNTAEEDGRHHDYEKVVFGKRISGKQSTNLSVEIRNSNHIDWGWEGELEVDYNGAEPLVIPNVRAIFVAGEGETT